MSSNTRINGFKVTIYPYNEYISDQIRKNGGYEQKYINLICSFIKPGDTVLDIGANMGLHTLHYSRAVGKKGKVLAFEPDPANLKILKRNVILNNCKNVTIYPIALSDKDGVRKLYLCERNKGKQGFADLDNLNHPNPINVEVLKASDIPETRKARVIKMDVEGAEPQVFSGFDNCKPPIIFFEFTFQQLQALNNIPLKFLNRLVSKGYHLFMIEDDKLIQIKPKTMAKLAAQTNHDYNLLAKL